MSKKIVITGGPGTGKTAIISHLKHLGFTCYDEISRAITLDARKTGIEQLFLTDPMLFSTKLLEGRIAQYKSATADNAAAVFLDRGLPDVLAYMDYIGDSYPITFVKACKTYSYDTVFILPPWEAIFESDNERYENFKQAQIIHSHLVATYQKFNYKLIIVPFDTIKNRATFILNQLNL